VGSAGVAAAFSPLPLAARLGPSGATVRNI
jgi:hypothetical protein